MGERKELKKGSSRRGKRGNRKAQGRNERRGGSHGVVKRRKNMRGQRRREGSSSKGLEREEGAGRGVRDRTRAGNLIRQMSPNIGGGNQLP